MTYKRIVAILGVFMLMTPAFCQLVEKRNYSGDISPTTNTNITIPTPTLDGLSRRIVKSDFFLSLDFGEATSATVDLPTVPIKLVFSLEAIRSDGSSVSDVFSTKDFSLSISSANTEAYLVVNFLKYISSGDSKLSFDKVKITIKSSGVSTSSASLQSIIRFKWNLTEQFGVNVKDAIFTSPTVVPVSGKNEVEFGWTSPFKFPISYVQVQVLRLFNTDPLKTTPTSITAVVDWSKAGTYIVKNDFKPEELSLGVKTTPYSKNFTVNEGSGFYLWRVRPVSEYNPGGMANMDNFATTWTQTPTPVGATLSLSTSDISSQGWFYFTDTQEDKNYNYSKIFSERGNTKEMVTYANSLNQVRQTATYLPSENVSIVTQTILDNSGRPALVTMPVPIENKDLGYRNKLVTNLQGNLYTADDFDFANATASPTNVKVDNYRNPSAVKEDGTDYAYYKDKTGNIPSAQGYPFSRTLFLNDGTGRVSEQSGVGLDHRLKIGDENEKHTTRNSYGTASTDEMIALFGDQAPNGNNIFKIITVDPNQTATVTYKNKEGQTIATGLAFANTDSESLVKIDEPSDAAECTNKMDFEVNNITTSSEKTSNGFVSSQRIIVAPTDLSLPPNAATGTIPNLALLVDYKVKTNTLEQGCFDVVFDCNYVLDIKLFKISDGGDDVDPQEKLNLLLTDSEINKVKYKTLKDGAVTFSIVTPGTYIVQKTLVPAKLTIETTKNTEKVNDQIGPVSSYIADKLNAVKSRAELFAFFEEIGGIGKFAEKYNDGTLTAADGYITNGDWFTKIYKPVMEAYANAPSPKPPIAPFHLELTYSPVDTKQIVVLSLSTPCCKDLTIPINYTSPLPCYIDENKNGIIDSPAGGIDERDVNLDGKVTRGDWPNFEKFMIESLLPCMQLTSNEYDGKDKTSYANWLYIKYMNGWFDENGTMNPIVFDITEDPVTREFVIEGIPGRFNEMIYHMSTDVYALQDGLEAKNQYKCPELFDCWVGVVNKVKNMLPGCKSLPSNSQNQSVSDSYEDQYEADESEDKYEKGHDDHFDSNVSTGFFLTDWYASYKISKAMRELNTGAVSPGQGLVIPAVNIPKDFLGCAGYKFAKILTPYDANPIYSDGTTSIVSNDCYPGVASFQYSSVVDFANMNPFPASLFPNKVFSPVEYTFPDKTKYLSNATDAAYLKDDSSHYYMPIADWKPIERARKMNTPGEQLEEDSRVLSLFLFKNILNPYYAFKYFHYDNFGDPAYQSLESMVCFSDPNDCYATETTNGYKHYVVPSHLPTDNLPIFTRAAKPCCLESASAIYSPSTNSTHAAGCYEDMEYTKTPATSKLVVREFTGVGRIKCPYLFDKWNAAQRSTFQIMLSSYVVPKSIGSEVNQHQLTIADYTATQKWYTLNPLVPVAPSGYSYTIPESKIAGVESSYLPIKTEPFIMVEKLINEKELECTTKCDSRRSEFRSELYKMLIERCYVIGGCRTNDPSTFNVIPEADIDMMVNAMVVHCKEQCNLSTFSAAIVASRPLSTPSFDFGVNASSVKLEFGMGGHPDPSSLGYQDGNSALVTSLTGQNKDADGVPRVYKKCTLVSSDFLTEYKYSWYEYTALTQVKMWFFQLELPWKCTDQVYPLPADGCQTHYLERNKYEVNPNAMPDPAAVQVAESVVAPPVTLKLGAGKGLNGQEYDKNGAKIVK